MTTPAGLAPGSARPWVVRPASVVTISPEILIAALSDETHWPGDVLSLTPPPEGTPPHLCSVNQCFQDWKVTVTEAGQSFVYIIKSYDRQRRCWIAAWPD